MDQTARGRLRRIESNQEQLDRLLALLSELLAAQQKHKEDQEMFATIARFISSLVAASRCNDDRTFALELLHI
ncbi:MAG: hypothetical protein ACM37W_00275 [Actinomycetota bacterium]